MLHLVGYLNYWQMGFNSVFKGLTQYYSSLLAYTYFSSTVFIMINRDSNRKTEQKSDYHFQTQELMLNTLDH